MNYDLSYSLYIKKSSSEDELISDQIQFSIHLRLLPPASSFVGLIIQLSLSNFNLSPLYS